MKHDNRITKEMKLNEAERRVEAKMGLLIHMVVAVSVAVLLTTINLFTQTDYLWFKWPVLGLSLSVVFHGLGVSFQSGSVKKRMINAEMKKLGSPG